MDEFGQFSILAPMFKFLHWAIRANFSLANNVKDFNECLKTYSELLKSYNALAKPVYPCYNAARLLEKTRRDRANTGSWAQIYAGLENNVHGAPSNDQFKRFLNVKCDFYVNYVLR